MTPEDNKKQQDRNLREMDYNSEDDIFNQEEHISLDENGNPIYDENVEDLDMEMNLDAPGSNEDNAMEEVGSEDEENNYWSLSDQDDHEEENDDLVE